MFQGTADGRFVAYRATDGAKLWEAPAGSGVIAAPITYQVDGVQYVTVMAGWGGVFALAGGDAARAAGVRSVGRMLTYSIGGTAPAAAARRPAAAAAADDRAASRREADDRQTGGNTFHRWCATCHGIGAVGGGVLPDLRYATPGDARAARRHRARRHLPGPRHAELREVAEARPTSSSIRAYVVSRARDAAEAAGIQ